MIALTNNKNKSYSSEFKFKVVLDMLQNNLTLAEIISKYQVPRSVISRWKQEFLRKGPEIFKSPTSVSRHDDAESTIEKLHAKIGRLTVENDFLQEVSTKLKL